MTPELKGRIEQAIREWDVLGYERQEIIEAVANEEKVERAVVEAFYNDVFHTRASRPQIVQPDQGGGFPTPADGAIWMAVTYGVPQIPLNGKRPFLEDWTNKASSDPAQIRKWVMEYPGCNFGSMGVPGKHFIFESDSPAVRERFGQDFTSRLVIESSPGKHHNYYLYAPGIVNIGQDKGDDFSIRSQGEQCVSPGSIHPVTGRQYRVAAHNALTQPTPEEISFWNSSKTEKVEVTQQATIPQGKRNSTLARMAGKLLDAGMSPEDVKEQVRKVNEERCSPPLPQSELDATIFASTDKWSTKEDAITRQVQAAPVIVNGHVAGRPAVASVQVDLPKFVSVGELEQGEVQMLIDGFLPEGTTFIGGLPGEGKTFFALSIARALTTRKPFLNAFNVPKTVPVIYLIPESGGRAFRKRCEKFEIPDDPELFLCRTVSQGATLPLDDASLLEAVARLKPVVILDTIIRFSESEDENAAAQNKKLVDDVIRLRQAGAVAVIGLHHAVKAMREKGMSLELALRGTGDIAATADAVYGLLRDDKLYKNGSGPNEIQVGCLKPRDFEPPEPFRIAASRKVSGSDIPNDGKIRIVSSTESIIDQQHDFQLVSRITHANQVTERIEKLVLETPTVTLKELNEVTGISPWEIRKTLERLGYHRGRGGKKGATHWTKEPEKVEPRRADVDLNAVAA